MGICLSGVDGSSGTNGTGLERRDPTYERNKICAFVSFCFVQSCQTLVQHQTKKKIKISVLLSSEEPQKRKMCRLEPGSFVAERNNFDRTCDRSGSPKEEKQNKKRKEKK